MKTDKRLRAKHKRRTWTFSPGSLQGQHLWSWLQVGSLDDMSLPSVTALSDAEDDQVVVAEHVVPGLDPIPSKKRKLDSYTSASPKILKRILASKCGRKRAKCFKPFLDHTPLYEKLLLLRQRLRKYTKLEMDEFLLNMLKSQPKRHGKIHLRYLNHNVCNKAWMRMVGVGKSRFTALRKAVSSNSEFCPFDMRYTQKVPKPASATREAAHEFLTKLYLEVAEPIPDGINSNKRPRQGRHRQDKPDLDRRTMKHLPYGTISDYHRQCQLELPDHKIGRELFANAAWLSG